MSKNTDDREIVKGSLNGETIYYCESNSSWYTKNPGVATRFLAGEGGIGVYRLKEHVNATNIGFEDPSPLFR